MRYWYDTEFINNGRIIELLSIGMVANDGREYYAINAEADWDRADVIKHGKTAVQIACDLIDFCDPTRHGPPELWTNYGAYNFVALCQLFGTLKHLPTGWPAYTCELQQLSASLGNPRLPPQPTRQHHALEDARWNRDAYHALIEYSKKGDGMLDYMVTALRNAVVNDYLYAILIENIGHSSLHFAGPNSHANQRDNELEQARLMERFARRIRENLKL